MVVEASRTQRRVKPLTLEMREVKELIRGGKTPIPFTEVNGQIILKPQMVAKRDESIAAFRRFLVGQLELTLRKVLEQISSYPEVEKIHLIAHSRGTDVAVAALRELTIGARVAGIDPRKRYKVHSIVPAAPDLDLQVLQQRVVGDHLSLSAKRFAVYTSPQDKAAYSRPRRPPIPRQDKAIGVAARLFASPRGRLGTLGFEELPDEIGDVPDYSGSNLASVNFAGATNAPGSQGDRYGHSYFRDAPSVSSDLVLMLRDDLDPGTPGRPLESLGRKFWRVPPGYPALQNTQYQ